MVKVNAVQLSAGGQPHSHCAHSKRLLETWFRRHLKNKMRLFQVVASKGVVDLLWWLLEESVVVLERAGRVDQNSRHQPKKNQGPIISLSATTREAVE
jgi:hypothetical protein